MRNKQRDKQIQVCVCVCVADNKNAHNFAWLDEKFAEINLSTTPQGDGGASGRRGREMTLRRRIALYAKH